MFGKTKEVKSDCCCVNGHQSYNPKIINLDDFTNGFRSSANVPCRLSFVELEDVCSKCKAIFRRLYDVPEPARDLVFKLMFTIGELRQELYNHTVQKALNKYE